MNQPGVHMCSPSWTPLQPPSPSHPSGSSQYTGPEHPVSCIKPGLAIYFTYGNTHDSMLFSGTLHSVGYIFPFLLCLSLLSFPHLFVTLLRQPLCLFVFLFLWVIFGHCPSIMLWTSVHSSSGNLSIRSNPLNLFSFPLYIHKGFDLGHSWMI